MLHIPYSQIQALDLPNNSIESIQIISDVYKLDNFTAKLIYQEYVSVMLQKYLTGFSKRGLRKLGS